MTIETASAAAYIVAALLFILALAGLSKHETAKVGNTFGIVGMAASLIAMVVVTLLTPPPDAETQRMVDEIRIPKGKAYLAQEH